ncbi:hypothetical protein [Cyanobacterium sp. Dongsha4]|uniref:hypothetical protein n=1 Tax=Cyanobacterium sp. DS4 TaxID=2878255 RepID=UPI002E821387|nr:hypothetical protein [Cyanobacterium sp. Dongsha4]WVL00697.1 hypothetical protein Dongsha4_00420 [Cyanobacterium sp. Dongsha4]
MQGKEIKLQPSLSNLVNEIHAVNYSWKLAIEMFDNNYGLAQSLRDLKVRLQIRLLRSYAPEFVHLQIDQETESEEALYSLKLSSPLNGYSDAAHLPIRVAEKILCPSELNQFLS